MITTKLRVPDEVIKYWGSTYNISGIVKFIIDWRDTRKVLVELRPWLNKQVEIAKTNKLILAIRDRILRTTNALDYDTIAVKVLQEVKRLLVYVGDTKKWGVPDVWEDVDNVTETKEADCESGATLIYCLCRLCGVPTCRLLFLGGNVKVGRTAETGGHAWVGYIPTYSLGSVVFIDWCYYPNLKPCRARPQYSIVDNKITKYMTNQSDGRYMNIWWGFNEEKAYTKINPRFSL